jgi:RNA polymerase primary sigma factor
MNEGALDVELADALAALPYRERRVIELRSAHKSLDEIGKTYNVTKERIRPIQVRALKKPAA